MLHNLEFTKMCSSLETPTHEHKKKKKKNHACTVIGNKDKAESSWAASVFKVHVLALDLCHFLPCARLYYSCFLKSAVLTQQRTQQQHGLACGSWPGMHSYHLFTNVARCPGKPTCIQCPLPFGVNSPLWWDVWQVSGLRPHPTRYLDAQSPCSWSAAPQHGLKPLWKMTKNQA